MGLCIGMLKVKVTHTLTYEWLSIQTAIWTMSSLWVNSFPGRCLIVLIVYIGFEYPSNSNIWHSKTLRARILSHCKTFISLIYTLSHATSSSEILLIVKNRYINTNNCQKKTSDINKMVVVDNWTKSGSRVLNTIIGRWHIDVPLIKGRKWYS